MGLTKVAIARPVFMLMLMVASVLLGVFAFFTMRLEENPDIEFGAITVTTVYPGAGPEEVSELVSKRIEDASSGVSGLREVVSSSQESVSIVVLSFNSGTDMTEALNDVRSRVDTIINELPDAAERPTITKLDAGSEPVMRLGASSPTLDARELRDVLDEVVTDRFARIGGVAQVNLSGGLVRELQVRLKPDALLANGVGILEVQRAIQNATVNIPSGRVITSDEEIGVRVLGEFEGVEDLRNMSLSLQNPNNPMAPPTRVRLSDVAEVVDTSAEQRTLTRLNGADAVVLTVQKSKEGNAVQISDAILNPGPSGQNLLKELKQQYDIDFVVIDNAAVRVLESLKDLGIALVVGIFLVTAIVYIFLHDLRGTFIVGIAIPICIMATVVVLFLAGFTINSMTLLAMSLAVGVLVDDCIVVLENIYRHLRMGEDPEEAALNGRAEIGLAAIAITLADVVVFVPLAFLPGVVGQFFRPLGLAFAVCVLISLFVSFTITPMLASRWYKKGENVEEKLGPFGRWFDRSFERFQERYGRALAWALRHRMFVFLAGFTVLFQVFQFLGGANQRSIPDAISAGIPLAGVCVALGFVAWVATMLFKRKFRPQLILFGALFGLAFPVASVAGYGYWYWKSDQGRSTGESVFKFGFFPPSDAGRVLVTVDLPAGASLEATERVVRRIESIVSKHPDAKFVLSSIGNQGSGGFGVPETGTNLAEVGVTLHDKEAILDTLGLNPFGKEGEKLRTRADTSVAADMLESIGKIPGVTLTVSAQSSFGFGSPIQMSFLSDDPDALIASVSALQQALEDGVVQGVIAPTISSQPGKPEFRLIPDRDKLGELGVSVLEVGGAMRALYEGDTQTKFRVQGREYDIRVMMDLADRNDPTVIRKVPITFIQGEPVYATDTGVLEQGQTVDKVDRRDKQQEVRLTADLLPGYAAGTAQAQIEQWMTENNVLQEGVVYKPGGQADVQAREGVFLLYAIFFGILLVYMLLASLFNNLLYPFIVQLAQPQALVGALLALVLTDKTLNIVGMIGIISLVGLVGKNAILLVDYANTLRERGKERTEALIESGETRLRPIMMTTLALVFGLLPVALAIGRGSEFRETIGITIIGGIALSTLLTLFVIPCSYTIFDDLSDTFRRTGEKVRNFSARIRGKSPEPVPEEPKVEEEERTPLA